MILLFIMLVVGLSAICSADESNAEIKSSVKATLSIDGGTPVEYNTVSEAIAAFNDENAVAGKYVLVLKADLTESISIQQSQGIAKHLTIQSEDGVKILSTITIVGKATGSWKDSLTFDGLTFETPSYAIYGAKKSTMYPHNITIQDCVFNIADGKQGIRLSYSHNLVIKDTTSRGGVEFLYLPHASKNLTLSDVNITGSTYGIYVNAYENLSFNGCIVDAEMYGFILTSENATTTTVTNCNVEAFAPFYIQTKTTQKMNITFEGDNTITSNNGGNWLLATTKLFPQLGTTADAPLNEDMPNVVINDTGLSYTPSPVVHDHEPGCENKTCVCGYIVEGGHIRGVGAPCLPSECIVCGKDIKPESHTCDSDITCIDRTCTVCGSVVKASTPHNYTYTQHYKHCEMCNDVVHFQQEDDSSNNWWWIQQQQAQAEAERVAKELQEEREKQKNAVAVAVGVAAALMCALFLMTEVRRQ